MTALSNVCAAGDLTPVAAASSAGASAYRLPSCLLPRHYQLHLRPCLHSLTFSGTVVCHLETAALCDTIVCNCADLTVSCAEFRCTPPSPPQHSDADKWHQLAPQLSAADQRLSCQLPRQLDIGQRLQFRVVFSGVLTDKMCGLYRSKYTAGNGETRYAATTQFEAADARRCFPCWDEPALKATFDVSVTAPSDRVVLSNMPVVRTEEDTTTDDGGTRVVHFATTPIMSTYLVACVVGEFDSLSTRSDDGVDINVYTPLGKSEQGRFGLECCAKILPYYKEYFGIAYPLPKLDLVAIPDFAQGAMENWGLVTFRETCLLVDPVNTSTMRRQWCAQIVGHELAHMWFGNLVTMEWWTDLWLNEGYADFMMFHSTDFLFPHYSIWQQFISGCYVGALSADALRTSHAIEVPVNDPAEIEEIFDSISYDKGACIIRMLHDFLGREDFRRGMQLYLSRHKFGNTHTEQLWAALSEASGRPVAPVMSTWTRQMGYPLVSVELVSTDASGEKSDVSGEKSDGSGGGVLLRLKQRRYLADGRPDDEKLLWQVPVSFSSAASGGRTVHNHLLDSREAVVRVPSTPQAGQHGWIKLNVGSVGFYRVQYPAEMFELFKPAVLDRTMPTIDRNSLLDDLFALVQSGDVTTAYFLRVAEWYVGETELTVWSSLFGCLRRLRPLLQQSDEQRVRRPFYRFCRRLAAGAFERLGWTAVDGEDHTTTLLRPVVISHLVAFEDDVVLRQGACMFHDLVAGRRTVHPDFRPAVYRAALIHGSQAEFDTLLKMHNDADLHEEKNRIGNALGAAPNTELLGKVLEFALSDKVRAQESLFIMIAVSSNRLGRSLAWQFYQKHRSLLLDRYKGRLLAVLVKSITEDFCSEQRADELERYFAEHLHVGCERSVRQAIETVRLNSMWLKRDEASLADFLQQYADQQDNTPVSADNERV